MDNKKTLKEDIHVALITKKWKEKLKDIKYTYKLNFQKKGKGKKKKKGEIWDYNDLEFFLNNADKNLWLVKESKPTETDTNKYGTLKDYISVEVPFVLNEKIIKSMLEELDKDIKSVINAKMETGTWVNHNLTELKIGDNPNKNPPKPICELSANDWIHINVFLSVIDKVFESTLIETHLFDDWISNNRKDLCNSDKETFNLYDYISTTLLKKHILKEEEERKKKDGVVKAVKKQLEKDGLVKAVDKQLRKEELVKEVDKQLRREDNLGIEVEKQLEKKDKLIRVTLLDNLIGVTLLDNSGNKDELKKELVKEVDEQLRKKELVKEVKEYLEKGKHVKEEVVLVEVTLSDNKDSLVKEEVVLVEVTLSDNKDSLVKEEVVLVEVTLSDNKDSLVKEVEMELGTKIIMDRIDNCKQLYLDYFIKLHELNIMYDYLVLEKSKSYKAYNDTNIVNELTQFDGIIAKTYLDNIKIYHTEKSKKSKKSKEDKLDYFKGAVFETEFKNNIIVEKENIKEVCKNLSDKYTELHTIFMEMKDNLVVINR
jgi:hypothetical protein